MTHVAGYPAVQRHSLIDSECCGLVIAVVLTLPAVGAERALGGDSFGRETWSFDSDWRFHLGDAVHAERTDYDDSHWRALDVPHDWSIEGSFKRENPTGGAGAFLPAGVGWYRKQFVLPHSVAGKLVTIEFDGVMANSEVWINGNSL